MYNVNLENNVRASWCFWQKILTTGYGTSLATLQSTDRRSPLALAEHNRRFMGSRLLVFRFELIKWWVLSTEPWALKHVLNRIPFLPKLGCNSSEKIWRALLFYYWYINSANSFIEGVRQIVVTCYDTSINFKLTPPGRWLHIRTSKSSQNPLSEITMKFLWIPAWPRILPKRHNLFN